MRYEIDIFGVLVPSLLVWLLVTYALCAILRRVFQRAGLYRLVWHRALFDLALFVCLLGSVAYLSSEFLPCRPPLHSFGALSSQQLPSRQLSRSEATYGFTTWMNPGRAMAASAPISLKSRQTCRAS